MSLIALPQELLLLLGDYLRWKDLGSLSRVCKSWAAKLRDIKTTLVISRDIKYFGHLTQGQLEWLKSRVGRVRHLEFLTEELRQRAFFASSSARIDPTKFFPASVIEQEGNGVDMQNYSAKSKFEAKLGSMALEEILKAMNSFTSLTSLDVRGIDENFNNRSTHECILEVLCKLRGPYIEELKIDAHYQSAVFPACLAQTPNLLSLTVSYPGFRSSNDGSYTFPTEILSLTKLRTLHFFRQLNKTPVDLSPLQQLTDVEFYLAEAVPKQITLPASIRRLSLWGRREHNFKELMVLPASLEELAMRGTFRVEVRGHSNESRPNNFSPPPDSWQAAVADKLTLRNLGLQEGAFSDGWMQRLAGRIRTLDVAYNYIASAAPFGCLSNVTNLDLSHNALSDLPEQLSSMVHLKRLNLEVSRLKCIPDWFAAFKSLQFLNLAETWITAFPKSICGLSKLVYLDLSENDIGNVPAEAFKAWGVLEELRLSGTQATELCPKIGLLKSLRHLDLSYNKIDSLPKELANLPGLLTINMTFNTLASMPLLLPLGYAVVHGELLRFLREYLQGKWPPANIAESFVKILPCLSNRPPIIKISKEYKAPPDQREGPWFFFNPEGRDSVGDGRKEKAPDALPPELSHNSLYFSMAAEAVYRHVWASFIKRYKRGSSYECTGAWSGPTELRDRLSEFEFAGHAAFSGLALASVSRAAPPLTIEAEVRLTGTAVRDQSWNARGHWNTDAVTISVGKKYELASFKDKGSVECYREPK